MAAEKDKKKIQKSVELVMGPSGSGKTHHVNQHRNKPFTTVLSIDDIKKELYGNEWQWFSDHLSFRELLHRLRKILSNTTSDWADMIYIDHPFLTRAAREQIYKVINEVSKSIGTPINTFLTKLNTPIDVCLERNKRRDIPVTEKVIHRQFKYMQYPHELPNDKILCLGPFDYREYKDVVFPEDYQPIKLGGGREHVVLSDRHDNVEPSVHSSSRRSNHDSSIRSDPLDTNVHSQERSNEILERVMRARAKLWSERRRGLLRWLKK